MANRDLGVVGYEESNFSHNHRAFSDCLNKLGGGAMKYLSNAMR